MLKDKLLELLGPEVAALGYELVELDAPGAGGSGTLRIYIDREDGITVDDCERVSHRVSGVLDVEDPIPGHYVLEVSSPGLDRPLFEPDHFTRFVGHLARVKLKAPVDGRSNFRGRILAVEGDEVVLQVDGQAMRLPFARLASARLVPEF